MEKDIKMKSYRRFLVILERKINENQRYTRIPKSILIDPFLSLKEKITWMVLASFLFTSEDSIFPARNRLAMLLNINNVQQVSRITKTLQDKGYLLKKYDGFRVVYELFFHPDVDERPFYNPINSDGTLKPSHYDELEAQRLGNKKIH